jgi:hypothetical protein
MNVNNKNSDGGDGGDGGGDTSSVVLVNDQDDTKSMHLEGIGGGSSGVNTDGKGLGLETLWGFLTATGIDKQLYQQVQTIVQHLAKTDTSESAEFNRKLTTLQKTVQTELAELKANVVKQETLLKQMDEQEYKRARVTEGLVLLRNTHYTCICQKSAFPSCLLPCLNWVFS